MGVAGRRPAEFRLIAYHGPLRIPAYGAEMMAANQTISPKTRRFLSADALFSMLRQRFESVEDSRKESHLTYPMPDVLMSALAMIDGTGYFSSTNIRCPNCLVKKSKDGKTQFAHQAVAAVLIHPQRREVIPLAIEPIIKQDGESKNDCERNATRRLLKRIKKQHPKLKLTVTEDGLRSRQAELINGSDGLDDACVFNRPSSASVLPAVSSGARETEVASQPLVPPPQCDRLVRVSQLPRCSRCHPDRPLPPSLVAALSVPGWPEPALFTRNFLI